MGLNLDPDKYMSLIKRVKTKPAFIASLSQRIKYLNVNNDGNTIQITPREWLQKKTWREINDILSLFEFA